MTGRVWEMHGHHSVLTGLASLVLTIHVVQTLPQCMTMRRHIQWPPQLVAWLLIKVAETAHQLHFVQHTGRCGSAHTSITECDALPWGFMWRRYH